MKKNILFLGAGYDNWKGGLYYVKNMLFSLLQYEKTKNIFHIYVLVNKKDYDVFRDYAHNYDNVTLIVNNTKKIELIRKKIRKTICTILNKSYVWDLSSGIMEKYNIDIVFPLTKIDYKYNERGVNWIPDFQCIHYPEFFENDDLSYRMRNNFEIAQKHSKLVLSSHDAFEDYKKIYPDYLNNVFIIPFVSAVEKGIVTDHEWEIIKQKYALSEMFFFVGNQFWPHKNHITVFKAINILKEKYHISVNVVCTGMLCEERNPEYSIKLKNYIQTNDLSREIKILGCIDRNEQLIIMEKSLAVIQPSLFEGWGTVVEDAKALNVPVVMSNIGVHFEQKIESSIIFEKEDDEQLAEILFEKWMVGRQVKNNDYNMLYYAGKYGEMIYDMLMS